MANRFIIPYGADYPDFETTITDEDNVPIPLSGTCELHYRKRYGTEIIKSATILDPTNEDEALIGKIRATSIAKNGLTLYEPGDYPLQIWVTFADGKLGKFPVEDAPYDNPTFNEIVIQQPL